MEASEEMNEEMRGKTDQDPQPMSANDTGPPPEDATAGEPEENDSPNLALGVGTAAEANECSSLAPLVTAAEPGAAEEEKDADVQDFAYTKRANEFTSEIFKIQIDGVVQFVSVPELKKLLAKLELVRFIA